jgi:N-methylhydantoinase A
MRLDPPDLDRLARLLTELDALCGARMEREGVAPQAVRVEHFLDIRYVGQSYELEVPLAGPVTGDALERAVSAFHALHEAIYGYQRTGSPVEAVNLRAIHAAAAEDLTFASTTDETGSLARALKETRAVYFDEWSGYGDAPVYDRRLLPLGEPLRGPAIIEQLDTTTVLYPGQSATLDVSGNLVVAIDGQLGPVRPNERG